MFHIESQLRSEFSKTSRWENNVRTNPSPKCGEPATNSHSIIREPNPIIMGALHLTMNPHIDMDEVFRYLVTSEESVVSPSSKTTIQSLTQSRPILLTEPSPTMKDIKDRSSSSLSIIQS